MPTIKTKDGTEIYYKDWGKGQPIVFSHGWPLSADDWDNHAVFRPTWLSCDCSRPAGTRALQPRLGRP